MVPSRWNAEKNRTENTSLLLCLSFLLYGDDIGFLKVIACYIAFSAKCNW